MFDYRTKLIALIEIDWKDVVYYTVYNCSGIYWISLSLNLKKGKINVEDINMNKYINM